MNSRSPAAILLVSSLLVVTACTPAAPSPEDAQAPTAKETKKPTDKKAADKKRDEKKATDGTSGDAASDETVAEAPVAEETAVEAPVNVLNAPDRVNFDGRTYVFTWSGHPTDDDYLMEYVPEGENVDRYDHMILLETLLNGVDPATAVQSLVTMLEERKASDPVVNYALVQNEATGEYIIDFVMSENGTVEWNAYRYRPYADGDRSGTLLLGVSEHGYEDGPITPDMLLQSLTETRTAKIDALANMTIPDVKPAE